MYVNDKLVITRFTHTIWPIFSSFPTFSYCFARLRAREIGRQNMKLEKFGHIVLETV